MAVVALDDDAVGAAEIGDVGVLGEHDDADRLVLLVEREEMDGVVQLRGNGSLECSGRRKRHVGVGRKLRGDRNDHQARV